MRIRSIAAFLAIAVTIVAAEAVAQAPRQFLLEKIEIEGTRFASDTILRTESKLVEGESYSEPQLRDAVARVQRLAFVLRADFRLLKGSEPGKFVLLITIEETKPLFGSYTSRYSVEPGGDIRRVPGGSSTFGLRRDFDDIKALGVRAFLGANGVLSGSFEVIGDRAAEPRYNLTYSHYALFGTRASVAATVHYREGSFDFSEVGDRVGGRTTLSFGDHVGWNVSASLPLRGNHSLRASVAQGTVISLENPDGNDRLRRIRLDQGRLFWGYDSTDDVLFPSRGTFAEAGVLSAASYRLVGNPNARTSRYRTREWSGRAIRYFPVTANQTVALGVGMLHHDNPFQEEFSQGRLRGYYGATLNNGRSPLGEPRFELDGEFFMGEGQASATARAGVAFRSSWGVLRFEARYFGWRF